MRNANAIQRDQLNCLTNMYSTSLPLHKYKTDNVYNPEIHVDFLLFDRRSKRSNGFTIFDV